MEQTADCLRVTITGGSPVHLTRRELQVVECLVVGKTQNGTARTLGVRPSTVHTCTTRIYQELNVSSRARFVATVLASGIIDIDHLRDLLSRHTE